MIKYIRKILLKIIFGAKSDSNSYIKFLRKKGISIGKNCVIYDPVNTLIDIQNPHMIQLGDNVRITKGVTILTHDYSWSVISGLYGECLGSVGSVKIGNNVFIGIDTIITRNVEIGDNVIIGAGSVVTKNCQSNSVYAGNPARRIMSLEDYYCKRKASYINEAKKIVEKIEEFSEEEKVTALREYSPLFKSLDNTDVIKLLSDTGYYDICFDFYMKQGRPYKDLNDFINSLRG